MRILLMLTLTLIFLSGCDSMGLTEHKMYPEQWRGIAGGQDLGFRKLDSLKDKGVVLADGREGSIIILPADVFFSEQVERVVINPNFQTTLNDIVYVLKGYPKSKLSVIGHSDDIMTRSLQQRQSQAYAQAIADYLTSAGISPLRITTVAGVGSSQPISMGNSYTDHQLNRRVEIISAIPIK